VKLRVAGHTPGNCLAPSRVADYMAADYESCLPVNLVPPNR
jgi:hypothetical protein